MSLVSEEHCNSVVQGQLGETTETLEIDCHCDVTRESRLQLSIRGNTI